MLTDAVRCAQITLSEFKQAVAKDPLCVEILGKCMLNMQWQDDKLDITT